MCRILHIARKQDCTCTSSEDWMLFAIFFEYVEEMALLEELQHRSRFAAGQNNAIEVVQFLQLTYLYRLGARLRESLGVSCVVPLNCQNANARARAKFVQPCSPEFGLPTSCLQELRLFERGGRKSLHRASHLFADLCKNLGVVVVSGRDHDRLGARDRLFPFLGIMFDI